MPNGNRKTQRDIARMLGISRSYVSRIEKSAIQMIKKIINELNTNLYHFWSYSHRQYSQVLVEYYVYPEKW